MENQTVVSVPEGVRSMTQLEKAEAKKKKTPEQALILMSHAHMQGGETSDSERLIPSCLQPVNTEHGETRGHGECFEAGDGPVRDVPAPPRRVAYDSVHS